MNIVIFVLCAVLMVFGIAELVRPLVFWWLKPETAQEFSIVVSPGSADSCEYLVRSAAERMRWLNLKAPCRLVCVNLSDDPEIDSICRFLALRYPYLKVSKREDLVYTILDREEDP